MILDDNIIVGVAGKRHGAAWGEPVRTDDLVVLHGRYARLPFAVSDLRVVVICRGMIRDDAHSSSFWPTTCTLD